MLFCIRSVGTDPTQPATHSNNHNQHQRHQHHNHNHRRRRRRRRHRRHCHHHTTKRYVVMDEGHKIKNEEAQVSKAMQLVKSEGRIILTGTPLQNNLHELWALLKCVL